MYDDSTGELLPGGRPAPPENRPRRRPLTTTERALYFAVVPVDALSMGYALAAAVFDIPHIPEPFGLYWGLALVFLTMVLAAKKMRAEPDEDVGEVRELVIRQARRLDAIERQLAQLLAIVRYAQQVHNGRGSLYRASASPMDRSTVEALDRISLRLVPPEGDAS